MARLIICYDPSLPLVHTFAVFTLCFRLCESETVAGSNAANWHQSWKEQSFHEYQTKSS